jgi:LPXTG-site transpeptidase (sortase) family protein
MEFGTRPPRHPYLYDEYEGPTGQRRLYLGLAVLWFVVGAALLAVAGYQLLLKDDSGEQLVFGRPLADSPVAVAAAAGAPAPPLGDQPFRVVIEKIGVDAPVAPFGIDEDGEPEVPYERDLVAWYTFSAAPATGDNAVLAGHVTWGGDAVFKHLDDLQVGDRIVLRGEEHGELIYRVSETLLVEPSATEAQQWMGKAGADVLTLITCGGDRFETDDEIGADYTHRRVVRAELIAVI